MKAIEQVFPVILYVQRLPKCTQILNLHGEKWPLNVYPVSLKLACNRLQIMERDVLDAQVSRLCLTCTV